MGSLFAARLALSITIANRAPTVAVCDGPGGPFCDVVFNFAVLFPRFFLALPMGHRPGVRHIPEMYIIGQQSVPPQKNQKQKFPSADEIDPSVPHWYTIPKPTNNLKTEESLRQLLKVYQCGDHFPSKSQFAKSQFANFYFDHVSSPEGESRGCILWVGTAALVFSRSTLQILSSWWVASTVWSKSTV